MSFETAPPSFDEAQLARHLIAPTFVGLGAVLGLEAIDHQVEGLRAQEVQVDDALATAQDAAVLGQPDVSVSDITSGLTSSGRPSTIGYFLAYKLEAFAAPVQLWSGLGRVVSLVGMAALVSGVLIGMSEGLQSGKAASSPAASGPAAAPPAAKRAAPRRRKTTPA